jgi:hypothetical protein
MLADQARRNRWSLPSADHELPLVTVMARRAWHVCGTHPSLRSGLLDLLPDLPVPSCERLAERRQCWSVAECCPSPGCPTGKPRPCTQPDLLGGAAAIDSLAFPGIIFLPAGLSDPEQGGVSR